MSKKRGSGKARGDVAGAGGGAPGGPDARARQAAMGKPGAKRRGPDHGPPPGPEPTYATRAAMVLGITLVALVVARAALTFVPGTWLWPLILHRFLSPVMGWGLWLVAGLALVPAVAGRAAPVVARWGDAIARHPGRTTIAWALGAAALAWFTPDRVRFVGDFLLRQGTVEVVERPGLLFPQALPLDVFLHYTLPLKLAEWMDANRAARLLGAIEAAMLGGLATAFARTLGLRGGAAFACAAVVLFGGYLGMFTGFSKSFAEMCVLVAIAGVSGITVLRTGRGLLAFGLAVAIGMTLHRSALGMFPALLLTWGLWLVRFGRRGEWKWPGVIAAAIPPLVVLPIMAPRIVGTVLRTDTAVHFTPPDVQAQGGVLAAAFAGIRLLDFASLALMLSPLAIAIPLLAVLLVPAIAKQPGRGREALLLATLALPFVGVMLFIHPAQGLFRDWDDFAATGVALSLIAAWLVGETLRETRRFAWLPVAVAVGVAVPAVQWLIVHTDTVRGIARVRAFVLEPPMRPAPQRGTTWDYVGIRSYRLDRYAEAQEAFARAAETSPSPRILQEWGLAATMTQDYGTAQRAYQRLLEKQPDNEMGWNGLVAVSMHLRDVPEAKRAALELRRRFPANPQGQATLDDIARYEAMQADSARRAAGH